MKFESIMNALGVESGKDAEKLVSYFSKHNTNTEQPELISANDAVRALRAFVLDHQETVKEGTYSIFSNMDESKPWGYDGN